MTLLIPGTSSYFGGKMEKFSRADTKALTLHNIATHSLASLV